MKQTFEYAVDADYINKSPYRTSKVNRKNIVPTRKKSSEKEVFTQNEQLLLTVEMLHKAEVNDTYLIPWIILLDFEIGARIGEVLAISESDILNNPKYYWDDIPRKLILTKKLAVRTLLLNDSDAGEMDTVEDYLNLLNYKKT